MILKTYKDQAGCLSVDIPIGYLNKKNKEKENFPFSYIFFILTTDNIKSVVADSGIPSTQGVKVGPFSLDDLTKVDTWKKIVDKWNKTPKSSVNAVYLDDVNDDFLKPAGLKIKL
jgi:hypothetical protein